MISLDNITVLINGTTIIKNIGFHIKKGEFFALIGPNGSGKSTIVKTLSRELEIRSGTIALEGKSIRNYTGREYAKKIATMSQHHAAIEGLSVYDRVAYGRIPYIGLFGYLSGHDHDVIEKAIKETDLWDLRDRMLTTLSGGEMQRVHLASCFAQEPDILILDEPTNHLDVKHQFNILSMVKRMTQKKDITVICVLHDINQAIKFADRVAMMKQGKVKYLGKPDQVILAETLGDLYDIDAKVHQIDKTKWVEFLVKDFS